MALSPHQQLELTEAIHLLRQQDPELVDLLVDDLRAYSSKASGRLVVSRLARALDVSHKEVNERLAGLLEFLGGQE